MRKLESKSIDQKIIALHFSDKCILLAVSLCAWLMVLKQVICVFKTLAPLRHLQFISVLFRKHYSACRRLVEWTGKFVGKSFVFKFDFIQICSFMPPQMLQFLDYHGNAVHYWN